MLRSRETAPVDAGFRWRIAYVDAVRGWIGTGQPAWLPVSGASMGSALPADARVLVVRRPAPAIGPGALVVYEQDGWIVCHRVLWRHRFAGAPVFLVKGDARHRFDAWVPESRVIGEVVAVEHAGGRIDLTAPRQRVRALAAAAWSGVRGGMGTVQRRVARWRPRVAVS
jgi:hypothetical protein